VRFGLYGINVGPCADPKVAARVARAAEQAGFDSVWTGEHVVLPDPQVPPSPAPPELAMLDPVATLAFVAAHTERVLLATGIIILPQRNPLVLAKSLASLDVLSGGRLTFGLGAGYLHQEFAALGVPFDDRGPRTDDYLDAILAIWTQAKPHHAGAFSAFEGVQANPRPKSRPHPPIVVGGQSPPAYRRAVARGNGWYGFALDPDATRRCLDGLAEAARRVERPAELGALEISITPPPGPLDRDAVARYADLGVQRLIPFPLHRSGIAVEGEVRAIGDKLVR
jgi:probable F420-dependent oxidoreductase